MLLRACKSDRLMASVVAETVQSWTWAKTDDGSLVLAVVVLGNILLFAGDEALWIDDMLTKVHPDVRTMPATPTTPKTT